MGFRENLFQHIIIRWPFDGFGIKLSTPILVDAKHEAFDPRNPSGKTRAYDYVHVSIDRESDSQDGVAVLLVRPFTTATDLYKPLDSFRTSQVNDAIRKRNWIKVLQLCDAAWKNDSHIIYGHAFSVRLDKISGLEVTKSVRELSSLGRVNEEFSVSDGKPLPYFDQMLRVIAGLCLYLRTLPCGSSHVSEWRPFQRESKPDPIAITNGADLCTVSSCIKLASDEKDLIVSCKSKSFRELSVHFRIGHWRRPPGQGDNPLAEKSVWVRPTMVRRDRLPEGAVPGGAVTQL